MSYWISLETINGETLKTIVPHQEGGIYAVGGTTECTISVTYNYGGFFNFRDLHERTGDETIDDLELAVETLGTERSASYWDKTKGNAGYIINVLAQWASLHPQGVWRVN